MPGWTRARFRRLYPWDAERYGAHLKALTPQGRRWRFCGMVGDDVLEAHAARAIGSGHVEGCFLDGRLIGACELFVDPHPPRHAQVALSVDPAHQRSGLGSELIARARSQASLMGASRIDLQMQGDNAAMIALARRAGAPLHRQGTDLGAALAVERPDLRRLPLALARDEASLLQGLSLSLLRSRARLASIMASSCKHALRAAWSARPSARPGTQ